MQRFLVRLSLFLLPIVLLAYPLDYFFSQSLRRSNQYLGELEVWNDIYQGRAACDLAIYGSSRAWVQFDPAILQDSLGVRVYNFGIDGHNFWLQYLRHLELIRLNRPPRTIVLSVDVFSLEKNKELYMAEQFLPYMLWNSTIRSFTSSYVGYSTMEYYLPLIRYSGKMEALKLIGKSMAHGLRPDPRFRHQGYLGMDRQWAADLERAKSELAGYTIRIDPPSVRLFERFIQECRTLGIRLILVYAPEHVSGQQYITNRSALVQRYQDVAARHQLPFLNFSGDSICLDRRLFYNATHLNRTGATLFTRKLAGMLKRDVKEW